MIDAKANKNNHREGERKFMNLITGTLNGKSVTMCTNDEKSGLFLFTENAELIQLTGTSQFSDRTQNGKKLKSEIAHRLDPHNTRKTKIHYKYSRLCEYHN
jgi:hypothetical protein